MSGPATSQAAAADSVHADSVRADAALADAAELAAMVDLFGAAPPALARRLGLAIERNGPLTLLVAPGLPVPIFNRVFGFGEDGPVTGKHGGVERAAAVDAVTGPVASTAADLADDLAAARAAQVHRAAARFAAAGVARWWLHLNPRLAAPGLAAWLAGQGLVPAPRRAWAKMLRGPQPLMLAPPPAGGASAQAARPCTDANAEATIDCIVRSYAMPPVTAGWFAALRRRAGWTLYALSEHEGGCVVGGAGLYVRGSDAWLGLAAVAENARGRGGQLELIARRVADAAAAGCSAIVSETGEPIAGEPNPSLANLARAGFRVVASRLNFEPAASRAA